MKIIEQEEVRKLLQPKDCIQLMAEALKGLESGEYALAGTSDHSYAEYSKIWFHASICR